MDNTPDIIVLKFADSKIPVFKETRNKDYIKYGEKNNYPEYLTYLFNKSAKHNAILTGKANYIFGKGFENGDIKINRLGETANDIAKKAILDIEIYGGFRFEVIWNRMQKIGEIYHVDYSSIRVGKESGFYYKECWDENNREDEEFIPAFNPSEPFGSQIYSYNEYRPMTRFYPLPSYIGCNNYVETDIEISKYYLSSIRNGMAPSKMIQFFQGEPSEDKKREIEQRFKKKYAGSENAGNFLLVFGNDKQKAVQIDDLSGSELDKMFVELNKTCQQEIFSGHLVTSPMLFGIKTEGQLGGNTELQTAYSIFQNTYSKPKSEVFSKEITHLFSFSVFPGVYELQPTSPIDIQLSEALIEKSITPDEVRELMGLPVGEKQISSDGERLLKAMNSLSPLVANKVLESLTKNQILGMVGIAPTPEGNVIPNSDGTLPAPKPTLGSDLPVNEHLKNLTGRQMQGIQRIIRKYKNAEDSMTYDMAKALLKSGYGFNDDDIITFLGLPPAEAAMSAQDEDSIIAMFDACGDSKRDYEIIKSKKVSFSEDECEADEEIFIQEAFKSFDVTTSENEIIELIKKDKRITPEVIAEVTGETVNYVKSKIENLIKKGYIEQNIIKVGEDEVIERVVPQQVAAPPIKPGQPNPTRIFIKYSYEGPQDSRNRPFCAKLLKLNRLYSRAEIEQISARLGYSVFDRRGGFWNDNGTIHPYCRHTWKSNIVVKK
jgi:hypothetical protein